MQRIKMVEANYPIWAENVIDAVPENGEKCVFGNAASRASGGGNAYFYKTTALIEFPDGTVRRFRVPEIAQREVIVPLDSRRGDEIKPGVYTLQPPKGRNRLGQKHEGPATAPRTRRRPSTGLTGRTALGAS